jgi:hypothetical protein
LIVELGPLLDVHILEECHLEICAGIARSKTNMSSRVIPHFEMQNNIKQLIAFKNSEGARIANVADEGESLLNENERNHFKNLNHEEKKKFLQLFKKAYWDGEFVRLKFPKAEFRNDIWATFSESKCEWHSNIEYFPKLRNFIDSLPFREVGRVLFFVTYHYLHSDVHYDRKDNWYDGQNHFIWFNPFGKKKFFLLDDKGEKSYVKTKAAFFDTSYLHGTEALPEMSYSFRVDGQLTEDFCRKAGIKWKSRE